MPTYLLMYDERSGTEDSVLAFLDAQPLILDWATYLPSNVFLMSSANLNQLTVALTPRFGRGMFALVEVTGQSINGLLPPDAWNFINRY